MYDIDFDYEYAKTDKGVDIIPKDATIRDGLYVLPNGRYMPSGHYYSLTDQHEIIYEPRELSPLAGLMPEQE